MKISGKWFLGLSVILIMLILTALIQTYVVNKKKSDFALSFAQQLVAEGPLNDVVQKESQLRLVKTIVQNKDSIDSLKKLNPILNIRLGYSSASANDYYSSLRYQEYKQMCDLLSFFGSPESLVIMGYMMAALGLGITADLNYQLGIISSARSAYGYAQCDPDPSYYLHFEDDEGLQ